MSDELKIPFPPVTRENWLEKIREDLKGKKQPEEFILETEGIQLDPFVTDEDSDSFYVPLDRMLDQTLDGIMLQVSDADNDHERLMKFLEKGASALFLNLSGNIAPEKLLQGIHLDYLFVVINTVDLQSANDFIRYLETYYPDKGLNTFILNNGAAVFPEKTLSIHINLASSAIDNLANALREIRPSVLANKPNRCIFLCTIGKSFLWSVAATRALRILWENIISETGFEGDIPAIVSCAPDVASLSADPNQALIELSYMTLTGQLGNADIFYSDFPSPDPGDVYRLRSFIIQSVFREEGKLSLVKDPVAGSLYIEQATKKIAEKVWEKLHETHSH